MDPALPASPPSAEAEPRVVRLERNALGQLVVHLDGSAAPVVDAVAARCFPWSLPGAYVSFRTREGKEVALVKSPDTLDAASRALLESELRDKVFAPRITRIVEHSREFGITSITAETDRGRVTFQIRSRDDIRMLSLTRLAFRDADGITYEVADLTTLDARSRAVVEDYL